MRNAVKDKLKSLDPDYRNIVSYERLIQMSHQVEELRANFKIAYPEVDFEVKGKDGSIYEKSLTN